jgi:hypothetical protein
MLLTLAFEIPRALAISVERMPSSLDSPSMTFKYFSLDGVIFLGWLVLLIFLRAPDHGCSALGAFH